MELNLNVDGSEQRFPGPFPASVYLRPFCRWQGLYDGVTHEGTAHISGPFGREIYLETFLQLVPAEAYLRWECQYTLMFLKIKQLRVLEIYLCWTIVFWCDFLNHKRLIKPICHSSSIHPPCSLSHFPYLLLSPLTKTTLFPPSQAVLT